jgi:hypothetical protein
MKTGFRTIVEVAISLQFLPANLAGTQTDPQANAVKDFFNGRQMLISYRVGSPLRGTYFFLRVHFCESGDYYLLAESRKPTGFNHVQVSRWSDRGTWVVAAEEGQFGVRCLSVSGQKTFLRLRSWPSRNAQTFNQVAFVPQGAAQCPLVP